MEDRRVRKELQVCTSSLFIISVGDENANRIASGNFSIQVLFLLGGLMTRVLGFVAAQKNP